MIRGSSFNILKIQIYWNLSKQIQIIIFERNWLLTIKLLDIIRVMHSRNVIHSQINHENTIITTQLDLFLIDFSHAYLPQSHSINRDHHHYKKKIFYLWLQLQRQSSIDNTHEIQQIHPKIDINLVCAILFWLINKS